MASRRFLKLTSSSVDWLLFASRAVTISSERPRRYPSSATVHWISMTSSLILVSWHSGESSDIEYGIPRTPIVEFWYLWSTLAEVRLSRMTRGPMIENVRWNTTVRFIGFPSSYRTSRPSGRNVRLAIPESLAARRSSDDGASISPEGWTTMSHATWTGEDITIIATTTAEETDDVIDVLVVVFNDNSRWRCWRHILSSWRYR